MKVGDYVRTDDGCICKVLKYTYISDNDFYVNTDSKYDVVYKSCIVKSSPNIIDLIEVGDYVNGYKVSFVDEEPVMGKFVQCDYEVSFGTTNHYRFYEADIKSIVTKEMFANAEYRVETN